jgi:hypothetical protein
MTSEERARPDIEMTPIFVFLRGDHLASDLCEIFNVELSGGGAFLKWFELRIKVGDTLYVMGPLGVKDDTLMVSGIYPKELREDDRKIYDSPLDDVLAALAAPGRDFALVAQIPPEQPPD